MANSGVVGSVARLWRFPVKSMKGERINETEITERGLAGDRAYALMDTETGKVVSAKSVKLFPAVLGCQAEFVEAPAASGEPPPVRITLPDGHAVTSDSRDADDVLSAFFGRSVTLATTAPQDYTIDQYHPDVEGGDPAGHRDTVVEQKLGSAYFDDAGAPSPVPVGAFFDLFPLSVMTTSTLDALNGLEPDSHFDERRFRMNVIVDAQETGFAENAWIAGTLSVGNAVRVDVAMADPRCVMTTLAQDELPKDTEVLRALVQHNRLQIGDAGRFPCAGVYAVVGSPGIVRTGDPVMLA
jgi:uncharacterized protein YcbX